MEDQQQPRSFESLLPSLLRALAMYTLLTPAIAGFRKYPQRMEQYKISQETVPPGLQAMEAMPIPPSFMDRRASPWIWRATCLSRIAITIGFEKFHRMESSRQLPAQAHLVSAAMADRQPLHS